MGDTEYDQDVDASSAGEKVSSEAKNALALNDLQDRITDSVRSEPLMEAAMQAVMEPACYKHLG